MDELTRDVMEAKRLGYSYGQYKVLFPNTSTKVKEDNFDAYCPVCNIGYYRKRANQIFCSFECKRKNDQRKRRRRRMIK